MWCFQLEIERRKEEEDISDLCGFSFISQVKYFSKISHSFKIGFEKFSNRRLKTKSLLFFVMNTAAAQGCGFCVILKSWTLLFFIRI